MSETIRILICDDHQVVRHGIRAFLTTRQGLEVVAEATDGSEAIELARQHHPDVILMDLLMPIVDGIEAIRQIRAEQPDARILVLTSFATDDQVFPAIKAGALGYLLKDSSPDELIEAIRQVHHGEPSLHPSIARKVLHELSRPAEQELTIDPLTGREVEVLRLLAQGRSNKEIARELVVTEGTVRTHVSSILSKLYLASRTQAALYALRVGLASLDDQPITP